MDKETGRTIIYLMGEIIKTLIQILQEADEELKKANDKNDSANIELLTRETKIIQELIDIAKAISEDVNKKKLGAGTPLLLRVTNSSLKRTLHEVTTKRSLHKGIRTNFKDANAIMNS